MPRRFLEYGVEMAGQSSGVVKKGFPASLFLSSLLCGNCRPGIRASPILLYRNDTVTTRGVEETELVTDIEENTWKYYTCDDSIALYLRKGTNKKWGEI